MPSPKKPAARTASPRAPRKKIAPNAAAPQMPDQSIIDAMVAEAAYYLAEKRRFAPGFEQQDWQAAREQIEAQLRAANPLIAGRLRRQARSRADVPRRVHMSPAGRPLVRLTLPVLLAAATLAAVVAQDRRADAPPVPTAADYARAERFLAPNLSSLVVGGSVAPNWLPDDRLWYRNATAAGTEFILVDPVTRTREPAFDHVRLAATLSAAAGSTYLPRNLPFQTIAFSADGSHVLFDLDNRRWSCGVDGKKCEPTGQPAAVPTAPPAGFGGGARSGGGRGAGGAGLTSSDGKPLATSPDGKRAVFIRDWNLWVRDMATGRGDAS